jgi:hypothetical protein
MARATHVKSARVAVPESECGIKGGIKIGDSYYWWKFKRGGKRWSKTAPKRSQLTQSNFYSAIYDLEDDLISGATADDSLGSVRDDVISSLEEIRDQCQESLDNMPEGLQQGSTGELLQERIDAMDSAISEFEGLELDEPDDEDFDLPDKNEGESDADYETRKEAALVEETQEFWDAKLSEFQDICIEMP